jgi:GH18 family chitinase
LGAITFNPGELTKSVSVNVTGDTTYESDETLKLTISGAVGAIIATATGTGTITNDDTNPTPPPVTTPSAKQVVGYFAEWGIYGRQYNIADVPADKLTVLNYAFAQIDANGEVGLFDSYAAVEKSYPGDTWDQPIKGNFNQITKLKAANPNLKVAIAVGGWTLSQMLP